MKNQKHFPDSKNKWFAIKKIICYNGHTKELVFI